MIAEYYYDPFGRRLWKDVGGQKTYYHYADEGLVGEYDGTGAEIKIYGYEPGSTWTTDPIFIKQNNQYYFYHHDHLGTPQKITAMNGAVVWSAKYDSFGEASVDVENITNNLRFPGQYYDQETGLHQNWFRYYDSVIGRYIRYDPIGLYGGLNPFLYTENNPANFIDPHGLMEWCGSSTQVSAIALIGATFTRYKLASECVGGKKTVITVWAVGPSVGLGAKGGVTMSKVCFEDYSTETNLDNFNGVFLSVQAGITFHPGVPVRPPGQTIMPGPGPGVGVSVGTTRLGDAYSTFGASVTYGYDKSISATIGTSTVVDSETVACCEGQ